MDRLAPTRSSTTPAARQRRRPDAEIVCGGEVSFLNLPSHHSITSSARASSVRWHLEAERLGSLEVDDQLDFGGLLDRQVGGFLALENAARVEATQAKHIGVVVSVAHEPAGGSEFGKLVERRNPVAKRQCGELFDSAGEECIRTNDESAGTQLGGQGREGRIDLSVRARIQNVELQPELARRYLQLLHLGLA